MTVGAELRLISLPAFLWERHTHAPCITHAHTHTHTHKVTCFPLMTSHPHEAFTSPARPHVTFILLIHSLVCVNIHRANGVCMKMHLALDKRKRSADYHYSGTHEDKMHLMLCECESVQIFTRVGTKTDGRIKIWDNVCVCVCLEIYIYIYITIYLNMSFLSPVSSKGICFIPFTSISSYGVPKEDLLMFTGIQSRLKQV